MNYVAQFIYNQVNSAVQHITRNIWVKLAYS